MDTAEVVHRTLQDEYVAVRIKASWALGNLSDALVLIRPNLDEFDGLPSSLLLNLIEAGIKGCSDNDKIKMNSVRALGNFLLLITSDLIKKISFGDAAVRAIDALVKNATRVLNMKVKICMLSYKYDAKTRFFFIIGTMELMLCHQQHAEKFRTV